MNLHSLSRWGWIVLAVACVVICFSLSCGGSGSVQAAATVQAPRWSLHDCTIIRGENLLRVCELHDSKTGVNRIVVVNLNADGIAVVPN